MQGQPRYGRLGPLRAVAASKRKAASSRPVARQAGGLGAEDQNLDRWGNGAGGARASTTQKPSTCPEPSAAAPTAAGAAPGPPPFAPAGSPPLLPSADAAAEPAGTAPMACCAASPDRPRKLDVSDIGLAGGCSAGARAELGTGQQQDGSGRAASQMGRAGRVELQWVGGGWVGWAACCHVAGA